MGIFAVVMVLGVIAGAVVLYRRRAEDYESASSARQAALLDALQAAAAEHGGEHVEAAPSGATLLAGKARVAYFLLKFGLPEMEVFPRVPAANVLGPDGIGMPALDFVICDTQLRCLCVATLLVDAETDQATETRLAPHAEAHQIGLLWLDPHNLPRADQVAGLLEEALAAGAPSEEAA